MVLIVLLLCVLGLAAGALLIYVVCPFIYSTLGIIQ